MHLFQQSSGQLARAGGSAGPRSDLLQRLGMPLQPNMRAVTCLAVAEQASPSAAVTGEPRVPHLGLQSPVFCRFYVCGASQASVYAVRLIQYSLRNADRQILLAAGKLGGIIAVWRSKALKGGVLPRDTLIRGATFLWP